MKSILLFILGIGLIMLGGDRLVDAAVDIAKKLKVPQAVIGATVVSIGATLPEISVSMTAAVRGAGDIAAGSGFGSVICNTALIAGAALVLRPADSMKPEPYLWRMVFFVLSDLFLMICGLSLGRIPRWAGAILVAAFVLYTVLEMRLDPMPAREMAEGKGSALKPVLVLFVCAAALCFGARLAVDNGVRIAEAAGISQRVIAVTFIALGTSLPELAATVSAVIKGHSELSLGTILGANILNLLLVIGIPSALRPFGADPAFFRLDIPLGFAMMLLLTVPMMIGKRGYRLQGILLVTAYLAYALLQF